MALFNSKVEYALRAVLDLASQPPGVAVQSREIAQRQAIP
jgi:DNA-binding IscR family transcriptional regulator